MKFIIALMLISQPMAALAQLPASRCDIPKGLFTGEYLYGGGLLVVNETTATGDQVYALEQVPGTPAGKVERLGVFKLINENYSTRVFQIPESHHYLYASKEKPGDLTVIDALAAIKIDCQVMTVKFLGPPTPIKK